MLPPFPQREVSFWETGPCSAALCCPLLAMSNDQGLRSSALGGAIWNCFTLSISQENRWASTLLKRHTTEDTTTQGKATVWRSHPRPPFKEEVPAFHLLNIRWVLGAKHRLRLGRQMKRTLSKLPVLHAQSRLAHSSVAGRPLAIRAPSQQEFLETNFSRDVFQNSTSSLCPSLSLSFLFEGLKV